MDCRVHRVTKSGTHLSTFHLRHYEDDSICVSFQEKGSEVLDYEAGHTCVLKEPSESTAGKGKAFLKTPCSKYFHWELMLLPKILTTWNVLKNGEVYERQSSFRK